VLENNPRLESVSLPRLERLIGAGLTVRDLASLRSFEAPQLQSTSGIRIQRNPALEGINLPNLQTNSNVLVVAGHPALQNGQLPRLHTTRHVVWGGNSLLEDLSFLSGVTSSLEILQIRDHARLTDISALSGLGDAVGQDPIVRRPVFIEDNPSLPTSHVQQLLDALEAKFDGDAFPGGVTVSGTGGG